MTPFAVSLLPTPTRAIRPDRPLDFTSLYRLALDFVHDARKLRPPPEDVSLEDFIHETDGKADYELRYDEVRIPEMAVNAEGGVTPYQMYETISINYDAIMDRIEQEQRGAQWSLVCALVEQVDKTETRIVHDSSLRLGNPYGGGLEKAAAAADGAKMRLGPPDENGQSRGGRVGHEVTTLDMVIRCVWADIGGGELSDPTSAHPDRNPEYKSPAEKYFQTRLLKHMPDAWRAWRANAKLTVEAVIKAAVESAPVVDERPPLAASPLDRFTSAELKARLEAGATAEQLAAALGVDVDAVRERAGVAGDETAQRGQKRRAAEHRG